MDYTIQVKQLPAQLALRTSKTVTMESIGPDVGEAFAAIMAQAEAGGHTFAGPPFAIYPEECVGQFPLVLCMPVAPGGAAPAAESGVELDEMPGCTAACTMHMGPYVGVGEAYKALQTWLTANGRTPAGPPREIYLNDPGTVAPDQLLTEVAWPIS
jgi:effector-binding domain-containing protein